MSLHLQIWTTLYVAMFQCILFVSEKLLYEYYIRKHTSMHFLYFDKYSECMMPEISCCSPPINFTKAIWSKL